MEGTKKERKGAFCGLKWEAETLDQSASEKLIDFQSLDLFPLSTMERFISNFVWPEFYYKSFKYARVQRFL